MSDLRDSPDPASAGPSGRPASASRTSTWRPRFDGLAPRVAAYLSLALLPLGLIALYQTREHQQESEGRTELTLLALTEQGAAGVGSAIERAIGAGGALAAGAELLADPAACSRAMSRLVAEDNPFDFAGILPPEGPILCNSVGRSIEIDAQAREELARMVAEPGLAIRPSDSRADVLVVGMPFPDDSASQGYLTFTIPRERVQAPPGDASGLTPLRLLTFNAEGVVLTGAVAKDGAPSLSSLLPAEEPLADHARGRPHAFAGPAAGGGDHVYTVAPLVPGVAYAMGIWTPEQAGLGADLIVERPLLFPLLMWMASLVVAFLAIHRLAIRHAVDLVDRMRRFGHDRALPPPVSPFGTPSEFRDIDDAFRQMGHAIIQDEARMENAFRERGVLLREVHHRVKNNLQLISSIISMQVRRMPEPAMRRVLRRLQDRVLTLASIYRSLYTSPDMSEVNAAPVIRAIVEQELRASEGRVAVTLDIEDMVLDADKVVPLAFLAAEAVSNAVHRAGAREGTPSLSVTLHRDGDRAVLRIVNSLDGSPPPEDPSRGLGQHLIHAFAAQVGAPVEVESGDRLYRLSVAFPTETAPAEVEPV